MVQDDGRWALLARKLAPQTLDQVEQSLPGGRRLRSKVDEAARAIRQHEDAQRRERWLEGLPRQRTLGVVGQASG